MSFGKKSQVCGILAGNRILEVEDNVFKESSRINSTFGGNLVDMVRFRIILDVVDHSRRIFQLMRAKNCCFLPIIESRKIRENSIFLTFSNVFVQSGSENEHH